MDLVLELKNNASKLLLAIMESRNDSENNAERILYNMNPKQLVSALKYMSILPSCYQKQYREIDENE